MTCNEVSLRLPLSESHTRDPTDFGPDVADEPSGYLQGGKPELVK